MTAYTTDLVVPAQWTTAMSREWRTAVPPLDAAAMVVDQLWCGAQVLPMARFLRAQVFPVVSWDMAALMQRTTSSPAPLLQPKAVGDVLADTERLAQTPSVLRIMGFLGVSPLPEATKRQTVLRCLARTVVMLSPNARPHRITLAQCDVQGVTVVVPTADGVNVVVPGNPGPRAGRAMSPIWLRVYEEHMLGWALSNGQVPATPGVMSKP
ncbi:hypothetical protein [Jiangella endophytica]|uniref:hypothetical protein n=1 Tax=Jiangella endophytica TaxID=1623398 RepID=UPI000E349716|nr:hypothetical protein [Jiangella endophytica]